MRRKAENVVDVEAGNRRTRAAADEGVELRSRLALRNRAGCGARPLSVLPKGPRSGTARCAWDSFLAIGAVGHQPVLLGGQAGKPKRHDFGRDRVQAREAIVDRAAKLQASAGAGKVRDRL